jgi:nucleotide-binding universal stress UspA family protein
MKILVPVDGSTASKNAVEKAIEISKIIQSSIKLITVVNYDYARMFKINEQLWRQVDGSIITGRNTKIDDETLEKIMKENASNILDSIISEIDFKNIQLDTQIYFGEPYFKILEAAKDEKFDLIVIGNRGFSKIKRFFIGSVAQRVIAEAPCPVLVIHTEADH